MGEEVAQCRRTIEDLRAQLVQAAVPHAPGAGAALLDAVHSAGEVETQARAAILEQLKAKEVRGRVGVWAWGSCTRACVLIGPLKNTTEENGKYT